MKLDGCYINLDRSAERRDLMEAQLRELGVADLIRRFAAVDGRAHGPYEGIAQNGAWACRRSHEAALGAASPDSATIVLEDDVEISHHFPAILQPDTIAHFAATSPEVDMAFLDCCIYWAQAPLLLAKSEGRMTQRAADAPDDVRHRLATVDVLDARGIYAYCAAAYVVTPKGKRTLARLFEAAAADPATPIDTLYNRWIHTGALDARIFVPFLATPRLTLASTIGCEDGDLPVIDPDERFWAGVFRRLVFAGNPAFDLAQLETHLNPARASREYLLGMRVYEHFRTLT
ncbi:hypothetical protein Bsp3421_004428 [Burkholderia sp. FERM BP-3421]|uniref:glycosyltransferase family 25 protein n=1 Tax=Burkholderia sp. FERM BP-3421 TaxID=1494466 RepID=UPI00235FF0B3|nr:hypothetical protein [Burkholderia sp. FERM BP-3421]WDD94310.1 hypothetical protein Bsp3421_004428 [Burkholderia sp. FERM BP-3421]